MFHQKKKGEPPGPPLSLTQLREIFLLIEIGVFWKISEDRIFISHTSQYFTPQ